VGDAEAFILEMAIRYIKNFTVAAFAPIALVVLFFIGLKPVFAVNQQEDFDSLVSCWKIKLSECHCVFDC